MDRKYLYFLGGAVLLLVGLLSYLGYEYYTTGNKGTVSVPNIELENTRLESEFLKDKTLTEYRGDIICLDQEEGASDCNIAFKDSLGEAYLLGFRSESAAQSAYQEIKPGDRLIVKGVIEYQSNEEQPFIFVDSYIVND